MRRRILTATVAVLAMVAALVGAAGAAQAAPADTAKGVTLTSNSLDLPAPYTGTFTPQSVAAENGKAVVTGVASVTNTATGETATQTVSAPVTSLAAADGCNILNLILGPLHLDLLGLNVDLNQVLLTITAIPGAGALLGNLLCAVAGLLDGPDLTGLVGLLNQILGLLR